MSDGASDPRRRAPRRCSRASGGCACRCPGRGYRTATPGRSPLTAASSSSTPGSAARAACAASTSPSAQAGFGLEDVRLLVCTHSHTDHYGLAAPIVEGAGCELWMHPAWEHIRLHADDPAASLERRIEVARQSGVPAASLERYRQRHKDDDDNGIDGDRRARPRPRARGRGRDRPRHLAGLRDPRPRPVPRRPAPARAQADDLRRPPARPHRALLRPRPQPRPGRRIPRAASTRSSRWTSTSSCPGTAAPSATPRRRSPRRGTRSASCSAKCATPWGRARRPPSRSSPTSSAPRTLNSPGQRLGPADRPLLASTT